MHHKPSKAISKAMAGNGAISEDEQGEVVMIPMFEKEHLLTYKGEW